MSFLLGALGIGKTILGFIWEAIKGVFAFIVKKPWVAGTILFLCTTLWFAHNSYQLNGHLDNANQTITTQKTYIKDQTKVIDQYVKALITEKKALATTIKENNEAVENIKKAADSALAGAQQEQVKAEKVIVRYKTLVQKYSVVNSSDGTAEERIAREQVTTDQFFKDWNKINE